MSRVLKLTLIVLAFGFFMEAKPTAEALIGHPATPASAAGVARRTVRRW